ncbi:MAG: pilus assembly protein PilP [Desulfuromonadales bacterium]|nr:pilus assembly protein PilP [Desulfuromonadales bacterium]
MRAGKAGVWSVCLLTAAILTAGCQGESPQPVAAPPIKKKLEVPKTVVAVAPEADVDSGESYAYDPAGRRDPFEPLVAIKRPLLTNEPQTPLQAYDISQYRLAGIIVGKGESMAMVMAPDGKSYILKKGIKIGKNNGSVIAIRPDTVLIEESFIDYSGDLKKSVQEIALPKREGA